MLYTIVEKDLEGFTFASGAEWKMTTGGMLYTLLADKDNMTYIGAFEVGPKIRAVYALKNTTMNTTNVTFFPFSTMNADYLFSDFTKTNQLHIVPYQ